MQAEAAAAIVTTTAGYDDNASSVVGVADNLRAGVYSMYSARCRCHVLPSSERHLLPSGYRRILLSWYRLLLRLQPMRLDR